MIMGRLSESLKKHFEDTSKETLDEEFAELEGFNEIGPDADEYIEFASRRVNRSKSHGDRNYYCAESEERLLREEEANYLKK